MDGMSEIDGESLGLEGARADVDCLPTGDEITLSALLMGEANGEEEQWKSIHP